MMNKTNAVRKFQARISGAMDRTEWLLEVCEVLKPFYTDLCDDEAIHIEIGCFKDKARNPPVLTEGIAEAWIRTKRGRGKTKSPIAASLPERRSGNGAAIAPKRRGGRARAAVSVPVED